MDMEQLIAELTARVDALEEQVEELRYAGTARDREAMGLYPHPNEDYDDYDYYDGGWDAT